MALASLAELDQFKRAPFAPGYPATMRTFYAPVDDAHSVLLALLRSATKSLVLAMFGYADPELHQVIREHLAAKTIYCQVSLDSTQAAGVGERKLLEAWQHAGVGNSISIGQSEAHAIMHLKEGIIDGLDVFTGSMNWSDGGERKQDNALVVIRDPLVAAEARARLDIIHDAQLQQMAARGRATATKR